MKLSILICTLVSRQAMLEKLLSRLHSQIKALGHSGTDEVEIIILEDQKQQSVGKKRNELLFDATGEFVVFVDDDDDIADDYVFQIVEAITKHPDIDCIGFRAIMTVAWENPHQVIYSLANDAQVEVGGIYYRLPGHLTPLRKSAIGAVRFAERNLGEDADFSSTLYRTKALKKEFFIDKVLYHYQFDPLTSETQPGRVPPVPMGIDRSIFHVIILSNEPDNLRGCLSSIFKNEPSLPHDRIIVVDDGSKAECGAEFPKVTWLAGQKPFVYARNANIAIKYAPNDVVLLNDDARLETRYGLSSLAYAAKAREELGLVSAAINGFVGNPNQKVWARTPEMRREPRNLAFVSVFIPRDVITKVGLLDERFVGYGMDDNDMSLRVKLADLFMATYDGCVVEHNSTENKSTFRTRSNIDTLFEQNKRIFKEKWPQIRME